MESSIVVVRSPCQENYPADAHPSAHKSVLESANSAWTRSVPLDAPGQRHGQQPVSGTADPGVVKQDKSPRGSVDTTKTRSDPQRVRMSSGERPIGAAKGKQTNTMASCQPPPPPLFTPAVEDQPQNDFERGEPHNGTRRQPCIPPSSLFFAQCSLLPLLVNCPPPPPTAHSSASSSMFCRWVLR